MNLALFQTSGLLMRTQVDRVLVLHRTWAGRLAWGLAIAALAMLLLDLAAVNAQAERHGIRVKYTSLSPEGGLEGRAFMLVSANGVSEPASAGSACKGQRPLVVFASLNRGPLRALRFRVPAQKPGRAAIGTDGCAGAEVEATLDDGSVLKGGQGYVELQSMPSAADPTFRGAFAQTTSRRDVPVTIEGNFVIPAPKVVIAP